jgi:hypothetical protein
MAAGLWPNEGGMTITRRTLYDEIDQLDAEIAEFNERKSDIFDAYRQQLKNGGRTKQYVVDEIAACKKAFRRVRALTRDAGAVLEADALVDEIVSELRTPWRDGTPRATRAPASRTSKPQLAASTSSPPPRGDEAVPRVPSGAASPISEAAPVLGDGGDRTDAASSHSAVSTQQVTSLPDGGNLAGTETSGHFLSETDAVVLPGSIVEPADDQVSIPSDEIEPVSDPGLSAGSPIPDTDPSLDIMTQPFYRGGETWPR